MPSPPTPDRDQGKPPVLALAIATLAPVGMTVQFHRTSIATVAPDIRSELALSPEAMSLVAGTLFLTFGLCQIATGVLLDRFGPRRVMTGGLLLMAIGSALFSVGRDAGELMMARFVLGLGSSGLYLGCLIILGRWYGQSRFALFTSLLYSLGNLGSLAATVPLAEATVRLGWRLPYVGAAVFSLAVAILVATRVRDWPPGAAPAPSSREDLVRLIRGLPEVLRTRDLFAVFAAAFVGYSVLNTISALWGGPFLRDTYGLDTPSIGYVIFALMAASTVGNLIYGPLDRWFDTRRRVVLAGGALTIVVLGLIAVLPTTSLAVTVGLFVLLGLVGPYPVVVLAHGRSLFPERMVGRGMTIINMGFSLGIATMQGMSGLIIGAFDPTETGAPPDYAYRAAFGVIALLAVAALTLYSRAADAPPSRDGMAKTGP